MPSEMFGGETPVLAAFLAIQSRATRTLSSVPALSLSRQHCRCNRASGAGGGDGRDRLAVDVADRVQSANWRDTIARAVA